MSVETDSWIFDTVPDAILLLDKEGRIARSNPAATELFGYGADELAGQQAAEILQGGIPGIGPGIPSEPSSRAHFPSTGTRLELIGRHKDGSNFPVEMHLKHTGSTGALRVVCVVRDIVEQKRLQEELDRFFRLSLDMLCIAGLDGYFRRLNPAWQRTLGYSVEELLTEPFLNFVHPDDRDSTMIEVQRLASGVDTIAFENRYRCRDGSYRWILWNSTPFLNEGLILAIAHDITDRKRTEEQLRFQNLRLQEIARSERQAHEALKQAEVQLVQSEKLSSLGQMVAGVAHEINNPLAYVGNNLAVLQRDFRELRGLIQLYQAAERLVSEHCPDAFTTIQDAADRMDLAYVLDNLDDMLARTRDGVKRIQGIVRDLRDFARIDSAGLVEFDVNECLRSSLNIIAGRAEQQGVELVLELSPLKPICCNPGKINQVLLNLMTNALDACPGGGKIVLRTREAEERAELHIIDSGQGIDPAIRDKIFDPFFTTKPIGKGTGLGLSISYGIIREHGGEITVESIPGQGTHFTVSLPFDARAAVPPSEPILPLQKRKQN